MICERCEVLTEGELIELENLLNAYTEWGQELRRPSIIPTIGFAEARRRIGILIEMARYHGYPDDRDLNRAFKEIEKRYPLERS